MNGSTSRTGAAAFALDSGVVTPWDPHALGYSSGTVVTELQPSASTMYLSGGLTSVGGSPSDAVAAVSLATGARIATWQAPLRDRRSR